MMNLVQSVTQLFLVALLLVYIFRRSCPAWVCWVATAIGMTVFIGGVVITPPRFNDYEIFLNAGHDVIRGRDPYVHGMALNTPQTMAVFAAAAYLPASVAHAVMLGLFLLGPVALIWLGAAAVRPGGDELAPPAHLLGLLVATLALSFSYRYGMELGQLGVVAAIGLLAAVAAQRAGYPWLAGVGLFIGSLKIATMLPFMFLFLRRGDWRSWAALLGLGLTATLAANPPEVLIERCRNCLALIARQSRPGGLNDVSTGNSSAVEILSVDRLVYCSGLHGPIASGVSITYLLVTGACIAYVATRGRYLSRPAVVALVSVYANIFLYHRIYDSVILAGSLVWGTNVAVAGVGRSRRAAIGVCMAVLSVWFVRVGVLRSVVATTGEDGWLDSLMSGLILPYPIWALIAAGVLIVVADRNSGLRER